MSSQIWLNLRHPPILPNPRPGCRALSAISHLTADFAPGPVTAGVEAYHTLVPASLTPRSHAQVSALFGGLPLVPPGVVPVTEWRPATVSPLPRAADLYAGVARAPRDRP